MLSISLVFPIFTATASNTSPFISDSSFNKLSEFNPNLNNLNIVSMTTPYYECKGTDLLIQAFDLLIEKYPNAKLHIFGSANLSQELLTLNKKTLERIILHGYESDLSKIFSNCSLFVSPGRGDIFPVATLEAMCAGIPTIVSEETGSKEIVKKVNKDFITSLNAKILANKISKYFEFSNPKRNSLSRKARDSVKKFREIPMKKLFKDQFLSLLDDIS